MPVDEAKNGLPSPQQAAPQEAIVATQKGGNWKGFVAGVFSGVTKLAVG